MADYTDGSSFVGLDEEAFSADQPLDVWLEQRLWSNQQFLTSGKTSCTATWYAGETDALTTSDGHRPHACLNWMSVFCIPVYLDQGLESIIVSGCYNVQSFNTQNDVDYKLQLKRGSAVVEEAIGTLANTDNAGSPSFEDFLITLTLSEPLKSRGRYTLVLWVRSLDCGQTQSDLNFNDRTLYAFQTTSNGEVSQPSPSPAVGDVTTYYLRDPGTSMPLEIFGFDPNGSNGELVWTSPPPLDFGSTNKLERYEMSWVQFRSITIEPTYDEDSQSSFVQTQLLAKQPVRGRQEGTHAQALRDLAARPRLEGWGPAGRVTSRDETWPTGYAEWWNYALGDGSRTNLVDQMIRVDGENTSIEVTLFLIASGLSALSRFATRAETIDQLAGKSSWDLDMTVSQLDDGDATWGAATQWAASQLDINDMPLYPTLPEPTYPFLYTQHLLNYFGDVTDANASGHEELAYSTREGMLAEDDLSLISTHTISAELTSFTTRQLNPVRVEVDATFSEANSTAGFVLGNSQFRLTCVGYAIHVRR